VISYSYFNEIGDEKQVFAEINSHKKSLEIIIVIIFCLALDGNLALAYTVSNGYLIK
jgi:hypothetical protein